MSELFIKRIQKKSWIYLLTALFTFVLFMPGCSKGPDVVGIWENTKVPEIVEFKADKTGQIQGQNVQPLSFTWQEIDKNKYSLVVNFMGPKKELIGTVQNKSLTLESSIGKETYSKRP